MQATPTTPARTAVARIACLYVMVVPLDCRRPPRRTASHRRNVPVLSDGRADRQYHLHGMRGSGRLLGERRRLQREVAGFLTGVEGEASIADADLVAGVKAGRRGEAMAI